MSSGCTPVGSDSHMAENCSISRRPGGTDEPRFTFREVRFAHQDEGGHKPGTITAPSVAFSPDDQFTVIFDLPCRPFCNRKGTADSRCPASDMELIHEDLCVSDVVLRQNRSVNFSIIRNRPWGQGGEADDGRVRMMKTASESGRGVATEEGPVPGPDSFNPVCQFTASRSGATVCCTYS